MPKSDKKCPLARNSPRTKVVHFPETVLEQKVNTCQQLTFVIDMYINMEEVKVFPHVFLNDLHVT